MNTVSPWHLMAAVYRGRWLAWQDEARYWREECRRLIGER